MARLAEAHVDAVQILSEAGRVSRPDRLLGVWAAEGRTSAVRAVSAGGGGLVLEGRKPFAGGAGIVDDALVTVDWDDRHALVLVPGEALTPDRIDATGWVTPALADTRTAVVDLDGVRVEEAAVVGPDRWYLDRPGFWHGAVGPAACWAGAAMGLVDHVERTVADEPHARAHLGAMRAEVWGLAAALGRPGRECGAAPDDAAAARTRALAVRHLVDRAAVEVQDRLGRALGPRPLVGEAEVVARDAALRVYRRQCHAERDLEVLGRDRPATGSGTAPSVRLRSSPEPGVSVGGDFSHVRLRPRPCGAGRKPLLTRSGHRAGPLGDVFCRIGDVSGPGASRLRCVDHNTGLGSTPPGPQTPNPAG